MIVVVADASPIHYLIQIGETQLLPLLFHRIVIPIEVFSELTAGAAPAEVREWTLQLPSWVEVRSAPAHDPKSMDLDAGEAAAIAIAEQEVEVLLLIDENLGRREATRRGIPNTGTLGVLRRAAIQQLLDFPAAIGRLRATNFRVSYSLLQELLAEDANRKLNR